MQSERRLRSIRSRADAAAVAFKGSSDDAAQQLVRVLVAHVDAAGLKNAQPRALDAIDEIVFATEVDGIRCVLSRPHAPSQMPILTPRECEIARMIGNGLSDKAIAAVLEISRYTVSTHLRRMYAKAGVTSRAALVARVLSSRASN